jgi:hypothetical protein
LVPNPKKAFQSPGVHKVGRADVVEGMAASCQILVPVNKLDLEGNSEACGRAAIAPEVKPDVPIQIRGGSIRSDNETSGFVPGISTRHLKTTHQTRGDFDACFAAIRRPRLFVDSKRHANRNEGAVAGKKR